MNKYFVDPIREEDGCCEVVEDHEAQFWTVYRRDQDGCGMAIFDMCIKEEAEELVQVLEERDALLLENAALKTNANLPPEKKPPELLMASYHEAIGWNACRAAMLKHVGDANEKVKPQNEQQNIPNNIPGDLARAVNRLLDCDGTRGHFSAMRCSDAREEVERLLAQPVSQGYKLPEGGSGD